MPKAPCLAAKVCSTAQAMSLACRFGDFFCVFGMLKHATHVVHNSGWTWVRSVAGYIEPFWLRFQGWAVLAFISVSCMFFAACWEFP